MIMETGMIREDEQRKNVVMLKKKWDMESSRDLELGNKFKIAIHNVMCTGKRILKEKSLN